MNFQDYFYIYQSFVINIEDLQYIINGAVLDFGYWLYSNILITTEGIKTLQKSLFSHNFSVDLHLFSDVKELKQFR